MRDVRAFKELEAAGRALGIDVILDGNRSAARVVYPDMYPPDQDPRDGHVHAVKVEGEACQATFTDREPRTNTLNKPPGVEWRDGVVLAEVHFRHFHHTGQFAVTCKVRGHDPNGKPYVVAHCRDHTFKLPCDSIDRAFDRCQLPCAGLHSARAFSQAVAALSISFA